MRTLGDTLRVTAYDEQVWLQERNVLKVWSAALGSAFTKIWLWEGHYSNKIAEFTLDEHSEVVIDVTDYLRIKAIGKELGDRFSDIGVVNAEDSVTTVTAVLGGLISPYKTIKPTNEYTANFSDLASQWKEENFVLPPSKIIRSPFINKAILLEYRTQDGFDSSYNTFFTLAPGTTGSGIITEPYGVGVKGTGLLRLLLTSGTLTKTMYRANISPLECGKKYALVSWRSFSGVMRASTFEVRDAVQTVDDKINLQTQDGNYNQIKGRVDACKLYLDDLDAYDYWYYSDLVNSSFVRVCFDGSEWYQVEVTDKSVKIPNTSEGKTNKLEVNINWRKYDAITL